MAVLYAGSVRHGFRKSGAVHQVALLISPFAAVGLPTASDQHAERWRGRSRRREGIHVGLELRMIPAARSQPGDRRVGADGDRRRIERRIGRGHRAVQSVIDVNGR